MCRPCRVVRRQIVRAPSSGLGTVVTNLIVQPGEIVQDGKTGRWVCGQPLILFNGQLATSR